MYESFKKIYDISKDLKCTLTNDPKAFHAYQMTLSFESYLAVYSINQAGLIRSWKTKCGPALSNRIDSKPIATDSRHLSGHCGMDYCGLPCQQTYMI